MALRENSTESGRSPSTSLWSSKGRTQQSTGASLGIRVPEAVLKGFRSPGLPHPTDAYQFDGTVSGFTVDPQGDVR